MTTEVVNLENGKQVKVERVLAALDAHFPFDHAFEGDQVGLLAGDVTMPVSGILFSLDLSLSSIAQAQKLGANLIVSHHPLRLGGAEYFNLAPLADTYPQRVLSAALSAGIALVAVHTNLDVSEAARSYWGEVLDLEALGPLPAATKKLGFSEQKTGQQTSDYYGELWQAESPRTVDQLAEELAELTGSAVRVYGSGDAQAKTVVTATGSGGARIVEAQLAGADLLISGEFGYHSALAAVESSLNLIELGHDVSELPLVEILAEVVRSEKLLDEGVLHIEDRARIWHNVSASAK
jgi:dinuclear metal center YbgI/SA1388 family protein